MMHTQRRHKRTTGFLAMLLAAVMLLPGVSPSVLAAPAKGEKLEKPVTASIPMDLTLSGSGAAEQEMTFRFELTADAAGTPMPAGTGNVVELTAAGKGTFGPLSFAKTGTYDYTIRQTTEKRVEWTLDQTVYHVHIHVVLNDDEEAYAVVVLEKEGETAKPAQIAFEDVYKRQVTRVSGEKTWNDNDDQDGVRPKSITVRLRANGKEAAVKKVTASDGWEWTFENLPKYENGKKIRYTVTEDAVPGYTAKVKGYDITNTHTPGKTGLTVLKVWNDRDNMEGNRPKSVSVTLYADGEKASVKDAVATLSEENGWTYTWTGLTEKKDGVPIGYTVMEEDLEGYIVEYFGDMTTGIVITNSFPPQLRAVSGTKTWDDDDDRDGLRPVSITVRLFADGVEIDSQEVTEETGWSYVFTGLPGYKNGKRIRYTVEEDPVYGYTAEMDHFDIINHRTPDVTAVSVKKAWDDDNDRDGIRPNSVTVTLLADGVTANVKDAVVVLSEANGWRYAWKNLPAKTNGKDIDYTIQEEETEGYAATVTGSQREGYVLTNSHAPETMTLSGTKTWEDNNDAEGVRPKSITVRVLADGVEVASKTVTAADGWAWTFADLPLAKDGKEISYTVVEDPVPGYTTKVNGYNVTNTHTPTPKTGDDDETQKFVWIGAGSLAAACLLFAGYRLSRKKKEQ